MLLKWSTHMKNVMLHLFPTLLLGVLHCILYMILQMHEHFICAFALLLMIREYYRHICQNSHNYWKSKYNEYLFYYMSCHILEIWQWFLLVQDNHHVFDSEGSHIMYALIFRYYLARVTNLYDFWPMWCIKIKLHLRASNSIQSSQFVGGCRKVMHARWTFIIDTNIPT